MWAQAHATEEIRAEGRTAATSHSCWRATKGRYKLTTDLASMYCSMRSVSVLHKQQRNAHIRKHHPGRHTMIRKGCVRPQQESRQTPRADAPEVLCNHDDATAAVPRREHLLEVHVKAHGRELQSPRARNVAVPLVATLRQGMWVGR